MFLIIDLLCPKNLNLCHWSGLFLHQAVWEHGNDVVTLSSVMLVSDKSSWLPHDSSLAATSCGVTFERVQEVGRGNREEITLCQSLNSPEEVQINSRSAHCVTLVCLWSL